MVVSVVGVVVAMVVGDSRCTRSGRSSAGSGSAIGSGSGGGGSDRGTEIK